jgi:hypothetical protein
MFCECFFRVLDWLCGFLTFSNWLEIMKIAGAALAFGIGLWQYSKSQTWKRLEFVAAEMSSFFNDTAARDAMTVLDWRKKEMTLYKYRGEGDSKLVTVNYELVASSLGVGPDTHHNKKQSAIREIFERFLEFLARFEGFLKAKVVKKEDLDPYLDYWTKLISGHDTHSPEVTKQVLPQLWKFIDYYGYRDVRQFINRYHSVAFPESKD